MEISGNMTKALDKFGNLAKIVLYIKMNSPLSRVAEGTAR